MVFDNSNNSITNGGSESLLTIASSLITSILFLASLSIFLWLTIKSKSIRNFQSQISLFIAVYVIGELLEINSNNNLIPTTILPKLLPPDIGSQIHVAATILLTLILWMRFYYFNKSIKELVVDNNNNSGTAADKDSNDSQQ